MDDKTFNLEGGIEIPILNLPLADIWVLMPGLFAFNAVGGIDALGRLAPTAAFASLVLVTLLARLLLLLYRRAFPGRAMHQLIAWYGQADRYVPGRDRRTYRVK